MKKRAQKVNSLVRLFLVFFFAPLIVLHALASSGQPVGPSLSEKVKETCTLTDPALLQMDSAFASISCFVQSAYFQNIEGQPSSKWLFLLSLMDQSCSEKTTDELAEQAQALSTFSVCSQTTYSWTQENSKQLNSLAGDFSSGISYSDSEEKRMRFRTVFGIDYPSAFFYFCKLKNRSLKQKLASLERRGNFIRPDFKACAEQARLIHSNKKSVCKITKPPLSQPVSSDELNVEINRNLIAGLPSFLLSDKGQYYVAIENKNFSQPDDKTFYSASQPIVLLDTKKNKKILLSAKNCQKDGRCVPTLKGRKEKITSFFEIRCQSQGAAKVSDDTPPGDPSPGEAEFESDLTEPPGELPTSYPTRN